MSSDAPVSYNFETLNVTRPREFVVHIEVNRPEKRNAQNSTFYRFVINFVIRALPYCKQLKTFQAEETCCYIIGKKRSTCILMLKYFFSLLRKLYACKSLGTYFYRFAKESKVLRYIKSKETGDFEIHYDGIYMVTVTAILFCFLK